MPNIISELTSISAEIFLTAAVMLILLADSFIRNKRVIHFVSLFSLLATLLLVLVQPRADSLFNGTLTADRYAIFFEAVCVIAAFMTVLISEDFLMKEGSYRGEYYFFLILSTIGMMFMVSSVDLITIFLSYEIMAISVYSLSGYLKKDPRSNEAGLKYFILGTLSTGIFLFGMSFVFGLSSATSLSSIAPAMRGLTGSALAVMAMLLVMAALFFKISAVPFHMWTPDVYEGAATPVAAFLSAGPKVAAIALFLRIMLQGFPAMAVQWQTVIAWISFFTMTYANIAALTQKSFKRMLAYSSIAHAGYMLIGFAAGGQFGYWGVLFYALNYIFMNIAAFALILFVKKGQAWGEDVDSFNGLAKKSLIFSAGVVIILMSLVGLPPTGGFIAKYLIFSAAIKEGYVALAIAGVLNSVVSVFYYFRIGQAIFMKEGSAEVKYSANRYVAAAVALCVFAILVFGIYPQPFISIVRTALIR